jgi:prolyl 4-hydroxylase
LASRQAASRKGERVLHKVCREGRENCATPPLAQDCFADQNRRVVPPGESSAAILAAARGLQRAPYAGLELFQLKRFLPPDLCEELIALIDGGRRPSTIADANGDQYFRTSETCDLDPGEPAVVDLEARLFALNRIDPAHGEPVQGQRYAEGQEFKAHTDYFEAGGADWEQYCAIAGQRTWTFMIYLNAVEAGGGTRFSAAKKIVRPETGKLLAWNNRQHDGQPNPNTLHHGMKVRKGVKYVITKWYRERPWS